MPNSNKYRRSISHTFFDYRCVSKQEQLWQKKSAEKKSQPFVFSPSNNGHSAIITYLLLSIVMVSLLPPVTAHHAINQTTTKTPIAETGFAAKNITSPVESFSHYAQPTAAQYALMHAVIVQDINAARQLLTQKPEFNHLRIKIENRNLSLIDMALIQKDLTIVNELLNHGAMITHDNLLYVIGNAINTNDLDFIKKLIELDVDLSPPQLRDIIFPLACAKGQLAIVKYFLEENILGEIPYLLYQKALLNAAKNHQKPIIHYLQEYSKEQMNKKQPARSAIR
jgi:hypothetical protein